MRPLSEATSRIAKTSFSRKYIALGRIVNCWEEIVGADLADKAQPVKINYRKQRHRREKPDAILEIAASSAYATTLHYQKDLILERMNRIFGEQWITDIRFVPMTGNMASPKIKKIRRPLTQPEINNLSGLVASVMDSDIKERLERLGQHVLMKDKL